MIKRLSPQQTSQTEMPSDFERIVQSRLTRRQALGGMAAIGAWALLPALGCNRGQRVWEQLVFRPVRANTKDTITVPRGFNWHVVASWGDPLWSDTKSFNEDDLGDADSQLRAIGDGLDGLELFEQDGRMILAVNNESINRNAFFPSGRIGDKTSDDDIARMMAAHGVSIFEIVENQRRYQLLKDSPYNRRITPHTAMNLSGPARGNLLMRTIADTSGRRARGTWANCGTGRTPWGTLLSCEENFDHAFTSSRPLKPHHTMSRYGLHGKRRAHEWAQLDERFDLSKHPTEANHAGYVVEIDPLAPASIPKKLTALGRFKHENAELALSNDRRIVIYMGDDEQGEYLYRYVSDEPYQSGGNYSQLLEHGQLYAARFDENGQGVWLPLNPSNTGIVTKAEVCVFTRLAASKTHATTMDRPEWVAVHPLWPEVYCALTNNSTRGLKPNAGGDPTPINGANPRAENIYGHIIRWRPAGGDHGSNSFSWDIFAMAGNPKVYENERAGSANIDKDNMFNSPDGLHFDSRGGLWIQTDGDYSNSGDFKGQGNNQMLLADPKSGEIRRFLVGPRGAEITGLAWTPDRRAMLISIQHPGERGRSHFPGGGSTTPRASIIAIQRDDDKPWG